MYQPTEVQELPLQARTRMTNVTPSPSQSDSWHSGGSQPSSKASGAGIDHTSRAPKNMMAERFRNHLEVIDVLTDAIVVSSEGALATRQWCRSTEAAPAPKRSRSAVRVFVYPELVEASSAARALDSSVWHRSRPEDCGPCNSPAIRGPLTLGAFSRPKV